MMITEASKRVIPFRPSDAKAVGEGCYFLDQIVWLNGGNVELGDRVGFNFGCYVNGYGGLVVGDRTVFGPYTMVHTANHRMDDVDRPIVDQGWEEGGPPVRIGKDCWVGMGACILPGVQIGEGCVIGAGSVVVKPVPARSVAVGNPATVKKQRDASPRKTSPLRV
jgi:maltose O-acetyltransferase